MKSDEKKCAILLSVCGPDTYATIHSIVDAETLANTSYEDLIKRLQRHYMTQRRHLLSNGSSSTIEPEQLVRQCQFLWQPYAKLLNIVNTERP